MLHLTSCVAHGLAATDFGKANPRIATAIDRMVRGAEAYNANEPAPVAVVHPIRIVEPVA